MSEKKSLLDTIDRSRWNPQYALFAIAQGMTPEEMSEKARPGAYAAWNTRMIGYFYDELGLRGFNRDLRAVDGGSDTYQKWLAACVERKDTRCLMEESERTSWLKELFGM